MFVTFSLRC
ncbi:hypothetical protein YPPY96_2944, partial [Yersinia pestis PY-96]